MTIETKNVALENNPTLKKIDNGLAYLRSISRYPIALAIRAPSI